MVTYLLTIQTVDTLGHGPLCTEVHGVTVEGSLPGKYSCPCLKAPV